MTTPCQTLDPNILPMELCVPPCPLVAFFGLDVYNKPAHKHIWDAFSANRKQERPGLNFKLVSVGEEFPVSKPKTRSYEWYHPKGIIKRNWLNKHLNVVPAVAVLFEDLEWADPQWTEKQLTCASHVQAIKNTLQGRNTRLLVILLQRGVPSSQMEDLMSSERAANLTTCCDINAKMLFVLPHSDQHLMNYVLRYETAFHEHAQAYYTEMANGVRSHRDQLTSSHQGLMVRHQFKLGIISELQQDPNTALKHFSKGYSCLDEIRVVDTNCMEIKTVAGLFNYKMCKLMFKLNFPRDAITQFKAHIEKYKSRVGFRELQFEHFAWLGVQNNAFAELFCEAVKCGLPALQTQHPGKYYYKAAEFMARRKETFLECVALPLSPDGPVIGQLFSEFFGVRAIKNGEAGSEAQVMRLLQDQERTFNHSQAIIALLGHAMAQYKLYKCLRFRKKLAVDMAEEYFKNGDFAKALTLYSLMLSDYRGDRWYTIFTEILLKTLQSAYLSASPVDFIACSIEALSSNILIEKPERVQILENVWKVFEGAPPIPQQQLVPELKVKWEQRLASFKVPVNVDLDQIKDILECKATFEHPEMNSSESYTLFLYVRNQTEVPLRVRRFTLVLWDSKVLFKIYGTKWREYPNGTPDPANSEIVLTPGLCYQITFESNQAVAENIDLQIVKIEAEMGEKHTAILTQSKLTPKILFKSNYLKADPMELIPVTLSCHVKPVFHLVAHVKPSQPMLVNEYFRMHVKMVNSFDISLQNVGISITVPLALRNRVFLTTDTTTDRFQRLASHIQFDIGDLQAQSTSPITYYIISITEGSVELKQRIWYQTTQGTAPPVIDKAILDSPVNFEKTLDRQSSTHDIIEIQDLDNAVRKVKEDTIVVGCVEEINFLARFYTLSRQALMRAYKDEDLLLRVSITVKAPVDIKILDFYLLSDHNITEKWRKSCAKNKNKTLRLGNKLEDILILRPNRLTTDWLSKSKYLNERSKTPDPTAKLSQMSENQLIIKTVYNDAVDSLYQTQNSRNGFIPNVASTEKQQPFGVYCIRWQRLDSPRINESKFLVTGVDVVEPPLNVYCYIEERVYVEVPYTLTMTLKNPTNRVMYLRVTLNPTPTFMYAGYKNVDISICEFSTHEMAFILYPLKAGWQQLPEILLEYVQPPNQQTRMTSISQELATAINGNDVKREPDVHQTELNNLMKRWMPKWVFVHPPTLTSTGT